MRPTYIMWNHHGKGDKYYYYLAIRNFCRVHPDTNYADFCLMDHAILGRRAHLDMYWAYGTRLFFVYPHAARPNLVNDIVPEWDHVTAHFVAAPGHVDVMREYGYEKPIFVTGWSLCPIQEYKPREHARRVLFAPIHPRCADVDQDVNRRVYDRLMHLAEKDHIRLTVRTIKSPQESGFFPRDIPGVRYVQAELQPDWDDIDDADVVVSHQTFAWIAVARGVPTVMMAENLPAHLMTNPIAYARNWSRYQPMLAYPYDILDVPRHSTLDLLERAIKDDEDIRDWKKRMIGQPFKPAYYIKIIEEYINAINCGVGANI